MAETNDGFILAERDLQQRGPGEFLGTRQAGYATSLKMANLGDIQMIEKARQQAQALFARDPDLKNPENSSARRSPRALLGRWERRCKLDGTCPLPRNV